MDPNPASISLPLCSKCGGINDHPDGRSELCVSSTARLGRPIGIQRPPPVLTDAERAALDPRREPPPSPSVRQFPAEPEPVTNPVAQPCCRSWADAQQDETDGECWGSALRNKTDSILVTVGCFDQPLKFCPWCAAPKISLPRLDTKP